jgi:anti-sigma B factor antagonist
MKLELKFDRIGNVLVVSCSGRIVFGEEATELCKSVRSLLPCNPQIILNLCAVEHVDSWGLGAVVDLVRSARTLGGDLKICNPSRRVHDLLQLTRLISVIDVLATEEEAAAAFPCPAVAA